MCGVHGHFKHFQGPDHWPTYPSVVAKWELFAIAVEVPIQIVLQACSD